ncbi:hypothetical protein JTB14_024221 [Gonioctena quinquepunctata]|nr:hypothetical protein JTB14_024221 [Gonioctena quinquepunctata]
MTLILLALWFRENFDFNQVTTPIQKYYYSLYLMVSLFFVTLYVIVITVCYEESQIYFSGKRDYDVFDYLHEQYPYHKEVVARRLRRFRERGGYDSTNSPKQKPVIAKADECRYTKCLTITKKKTNSMLYITRGILRNMKQHRSKLTKDDENLMKIMIAYMFRYNTHEKYYFFVGKLGDGKATLVDDSVLRNMEKILNIVLEKPSEMKRKIHDRSMEKNWRKIEKIEANLLALSNTLNKIHIDAYE